MRFLDIGSGLVGLLMFVGRERPNMTVEGIESAPLPFAMAWLRLKLTAGPNVRALYGDFWGHDLSDYDVVYAFLSPAPMAALFEKVKKEMKPGSMFISNSFAVPEVAPDEIIKVDDKRKTQLLIWRF
ncbi:MAG: hypothetical protein HOB37_09965 [Rhodospirillaceae bacterium]|jgi:hypothetical protein|nr:hypothetical protein [Rhodospirillaceae bacterium]